jgi:hypothetical protein
MVPEDCESLLTGRRKFLSQLTLAAAGTGLTFERSAQATEAEPAAPLLPTIQLGDHRVTRLFAGWNPLGGYSYLGPNANQDMKEYFTPQHIVEFLEKCEREGINAHQFSKPEMMTDILRTLRQRGSKMKFICLHSGGANQMPVKQLVEDTQPIAIVHHGGATDKMFRQGKSKEVHDFVKRVHDAGVLAGVSAHNPDCIKQVADEDWETDLFMGCFYYLTRTPEELQQGPPVVTVQIGYSFFAEDPPRMTEVMRQVDQPCLGFKILAAGRKCGSPNVVRDAFKFAFENIKPTDGVIVGMYPKHRDEVHEDAEHVRRFAQPPKA